MVWFKQRIPRCGFIAWLAVRDRLSTGVRMHSWALIQPCVFCGERDEIRDHLFFACPFSFIICSDALLHQRQDPDRHITLTAMIVGSGDYLNDILLKLCFQVTLYLIWWERNSRFHQNRYATTSPITKRIEKLIRNKISSRGYASKPEIWNLQQRWFALSPSARNR